MLTFLPSLQKEPVNGNLSSQCSLPLEVDTDEKQDQKATVNNSFHSKTKPAGPLGKKGGDCFTFHYFPASHLLHPWARANSSLNRNVLVSKEAASTP